jgi:hypothetical protein
VPLVAADRFPIASQPLWLTLVIHWYAAGKTVDDVCRTREGGSMLKMSCIRNATLLLCFITLGLVFTGCGQSEGSIEQPFGRCLDYQYPPPCQPGDTTSCTRFEPGKRCWLDEEGNIHCPPGGPTSSRCVEYICNRYYVEESWGDMKPCIPQ